MRCAGRVVCPGCGVSNGISPATCTTLGTVGPGEHWTTKQVPTNAGPPPVDGAACLDVVFEGVAAPLSCGVQLDVGSLGYRQLTYIFVDDVQGWGGAPSVFYDVSSY
jgi:hypothetical protein